MIEIVINVILISIIISCLPYNFTENEICVDYCFLWMRFIYLLINLLIYSFDFCTPALLLIMIHFVLFLIINFA